jgi:hypothetical protein
MMLFAMLSPASRSAVCGPEDAASGCPAVPPLGDVGDRTGRLGLRRRPDGPTVLSVASVWALALSSHCNMLSVLACVHHAHCPGRRQPESGQTKGHVLLA